MSNTKQKAAAARAAAAKKADAGERISALEVERRGYVQRGDEAGIAATDDEIAHWSKIVGIPIEAGETGDVPQSLEEALDVIARLDEEIIGLAEEYGPLRESLEVSQATATRLEQELADSQATVTGLEQEVEAFKVQTDSTPAVETTTADDSTPGAETPIEPEQKPRGRAKAAATATD